MMKIVISEEFLTQLQKDAEKKVQDQVLRMLSRESGQFNEEYYRITDKVIQAVSDKIVKENQHEILKAMDLDNIRKMAEIKAATSIAGGR